MSGIGFIIIIIELAPLMGHPNAPNVIQGVTNLPQVIQTLDPVATIIGLLTLAIIFLTPPRINRVIPAPLIALIFCSLILVQLNNLPNHLLMSLELFQKFLVVYKVLHLLYQNHKL